MFVQDVIELTREFYKSHRLERDEILKQNQTKTFNNLASRGLLISKIAADDIGKLYGEELKARTKNAWNYLQKIFERQDVFFTTDEMEKIKEEITDLTNTELKQLSDGISAELSRMNQSNYMDTVNKCLSSARHQIISKIVIELKLFLAAEARLKPKIKQSPKTPYVDEQRIRDLKSIKSSKFDLTRLIRLCEELNSSHKIESFMSVAMAVRAIIDHVPPIFGTTSFSEVANNYKGTASFKGSMKNLENSLRKIADAHLHVQIRKKETLPTFNQVNFIADVDVLLAEIIRILK